MSRRNMRRLVGAKKSVVNALKHKLKHTWEVREWNNKELPEARNIRHLQKYGLFNRRDGRTDRRKETVEKVRYRDVTQLWKNIRILASVVVVVVVGDFWISVLIRLEMLHLEKIQFQYCIFTKNKNIPWEIILAWGRTWGGQGGEERKREGYVKSRGDIRKRGLRGECF